MNEQPAQQTRNGPEAPPPLGRVIGRISHVICAESFPTGQRAALRRVVPGHPLPLSFYGFADGFLPEGWTHRKDDWATLVAGIAIMSPRSHDPRAAFGQALAAAGYSEVRLERLLQARDDTVRTLLLRAARLLAAKHMPCNWLECARLLLTRDAERREDIRMEVARSFYGGLRAQDHRTANQGR